MARDPRSRHELQQRLEELLGQEAAHTLMEALPPHSWDELATRADLALLRSDVESVKGDVAVLKGDVAVLKGDVAVLKGDVAVLKDDVALLRLGFDRLDGKLDRLDERWNATLDSTKHEITAAFRGELNAAISGQTRTILFSIIGAMLGTGSLVIAASHLA